MVGRISNTTRLGSCLANLAFDLCDRIIFSQFSDGFDTLFFVTYYQGGEEYYSNRIGSISQKIVMKLCNVQHPILSAKVLQDLNNNMIIFVRDFIGHDPCLLKQKCSSSLTFEDIFQLRAYLIQAFGPTVIQALVDSANENQVLKNNLLELKTNHIYEIYGPPGAGKTQFGLAMVARLSEEGQVFYIDTKNDFSISRLKSMMVMKNLQMLSNVSIAKAFDLHEAIKMTEILSKATTLANPKLLILDNIASLIWPLLDGEKFDEVFIRIAKLQSNLRRIAFQHKMAILVVNNAVNNGTRPALGKLFSKVANTRLFIKNNEITFEKCSPFDKLKQGDKFRININENGVVKVD